MDVQVRLEPTAIFTGLLVGLCVALAFALRPLVALRTVSPLQALRRDTDPSAARRPWHVRLRSAVRDWPSLLVNAALVGSVVGIAVSRSPSVGEGLWLSAGIAAVLLVLWASAALLSYLARRLLRAHWPYVVRQGVANLYRPANQTRAVVLALGFGAFLVSTIYLVQSNLLRQFAVNAQASSGNLLFFDVQEDQGAGVDSLVRAAGHRVVQRTPIVNMRIAEINGFGMAALTDTTNPDGVRRSTWALRREYRSTYRDSLVRSEKLTAGRWFGQGTRAAADTIAEVSFEQDVATELGLEIGDTVTWDVQGVRIPTRVTSFREVNWARFEPNFFAVLSPAALEAAPKQFVILAEVPSGDPVARIQRGVVDRYPNVSSIDLSLILRTVAGILDRVRVAVRFMALFSLVMGLPVLFTAVAATRRERMREGVLLKTLGATRGQIGRIMLAEYALLGTLGALTGMVLSFGGAWALVRFVFDGEFAPAWGPAVGIAAILVALTLAIGLLTGRDVFKETPMAALRDA